MTHDSKFIQDSPKTKKAWPNKVKKRGFAKVRRSVIQDRYSLYLPSVVVSMQPYT